MSIDIQEAHAVVPFLDDVAVPNLVVYRPRHVDLESEWSVNQGANYRYGRAASVPKTILLSGYFRVLTTVS